jgi:hypothetical protein
MPTISSNTHTFIHFIQMKDMKHIKGYVCQCSKCHLSRYIKNHPKRILKKRKSIDNLSIFLDENY